MKMFDQVKGYATAANAEKKLASVINPEDYQYLIAVTSAGRFIPVVTGSKNGQSYTHLASFGICVLG